MSPELDKLAKAYVKARKRMMMQRNFSEWCKFSYKRKVSKHEWCPEAGAGLVLPDELMSGRCTTWSTVLLTEVRGLGRASKEVMR